VDAENLLLLLLLLAELVFAADSPRYSAYDLSKMYF
jgi:hypothetical protein